MRFVRLIGLMVAAALAVSACSRGGQETPETSAFSAAPSTVASTLADSGEEASTTAASGTAAASASAEPASAEPDSSTTTSAAAPASGLPPYEVIHRLIEDDRETLVIVAEPGAYSNVELENLVYDIVENHSPRGAIVVDDPAAADLAILDTRTDEQQAALDSHTLLSIDNGVEVTFHGPYADFPGLTVGS